jgi:hypothetical protein
VKHIRWSDNDLYFGPFTYAREGTHYRSLAIVLGSGDGQHGDYPGCRLRLIAFGHTLIIALPPIIKPWRKWVDTSQHQWASDRGGYWDTGEREYGFRLSDGHLSVALGRVTHDSSTEQRWGCFLPWKQWRHVRHSLYDLEGRFFCNMPEWGFGHPNGWAVRNALEDACPSMRFEFDDYDGERIVATSRIEEREWLFGTGWFKWLSLFRKPKIRRDLDLRFSAETGKRKGSWKGGTVGHSIDMLPGELHEAAFRRYCAENNMTFVGPSEPDATATLSRAAAGRG